MGKPWIPLLDARQHTPSSPLRPLGLGQHAHSGASPTESTSPASPPEPAPTADAHHATPPAPEVLDALQRPLRELRISLTDRCNLRCRYCMPREQFDTHTYLPRADVLQDEEIVRLARLFAQLGVRKLRLTGGEPLLRRGLPHLIAQLARLRTPQGQALELCLTTNGLQLPQHAHALKAAGLHRLTVSLDALSDAVFGRMADVNLPVQRVLDGIAAAQAAGLGQGLKLNMVVQRGVNEDEVLPMARYARAQGLALRLIEYMDVGSTNGWQLDHVVPSHELLARLQAEFSLIALPRRAGETASRWAHAHDQEPESGSGSGRGKNTAAKGEIGFISSVTQAFCGDCTRLRLSADGQLYRCLFASQGHDLRQMLRSPASDAQLQQHIQQLWQQRSERHSQLRQLHPRNSARSATDPTPNTTSGLAGQRRIEMSYIGG